MADDEAVKKRGIRNIARNPMTQTDADGIHQKRDGQLAANISKAMRHGLPWGKLRLLKSAPDRSQCLLTRVSLHGVGGEPEEEEKSANVSEGGEKNAGGQRGIDAHPFERQRDHDAG